MYGEIIKIIKNEMSCFQKSIFYAGIKIFNNLPPSVTILKNDKAKENTYIITPFTLNEFFMCKGDLQHCFCKTFLVFAL
jgi:hypothetical protein